MKTKKATKFRSNLKFLISFFLEKGKGIKRLIKNNFVGHIPIKFTLTNTHSSQRFCPIVIANYINGYFFSFRQSENFLGHFLGIFDQFWVIAKGILKYFFRELLAQKQKKKKFVSPEDWFEVRLVLKIGWPYLGHPDSPRGLARRLFHEPARVRSLFIHLLTWINLEFIV